MIKKLVVALLFLALFALSVAVKGGGILGIYGAVLLVYLITKMFLSFFYRPFGGEVKRGIKIDCVIPTYNENGEGLIETLESLAVQTYPIRKIYLIDDGSSDKSGFEMVKKHIKSNPEKFSNVFTHSARRAIKASVTRRLGLLGLQMRICFLLSILILISIQMRLKSWLNVLIMSKFMLRQDISMRAIGMKICSRN